MHPHPDLTTHGCILLQHHWSPSTGQYLIAWQRTLPVSRLLHNRTMPHSATRVLYP